MSGLTLERARELLKKHTTQEHLFVHAAAVSACMGGMAGLYGGDREHWEALGYLHDVDYEQYPDVSEHCHHVRELLEPEGVEEADIRAIISHGYGLTQQEVKPETDEEKCLFTVDELSGIILAYAKMRPDGMDGMEVKSFKKKFKDKRFAAGCSREVIEEGIAMLGLDASAVMQSCIDGMTAHKDELGLG